MGYEQTLDYFEAAEDVTLSRAGALRLLGKHHMGNPEAIAEFDEDMGEIKDEYPAQAVLAWLGY